jgi:hypothetical protein
MLRDIPFSEAKATLRKFLLEQGLSSDLVWLFREDVSSRAGRLLIKSPVPRENEELSEAYYEVGRKRDLGIGLHTFCLLDSQPCCYVELPEDDVDAQYLLMGNLNLKCSVSDSLTKAQPVTNRLLWAAYKLVERTSKPSLLIPDRLPSKKSRNIGSRKESDGPNE